MIECQESLSPIHFEELREQIDKESYEIRDWRQWVARIQLDEIEANYKEGDKQAIIDAMYVCADACLDHPDWLRNAFLNSVQAVRGYGAKSWDEVFGKPHDKGVNIRARAKKIKYQWAVYASVKNSGRAIDASLFEDVGKFYGLGKTLTEEIYYTGKPLYDAWIKKYGEKIMIEQPVVFDTDPAVQK